MNPSCLLSPPGPYQRLYKFTILTPHTFLPPNHSESLEDALAVEFAQFLCDRVSSELGARSYTPQGCGEAFLNMMFDEFEERFLRHSEYVIFITSGYNAGCLDLIYPRMLVFLTIRPTWRNRGIVLYLGPPAVQQVFDPNLFATRPLIFPAMRDAWEAFEGPWDRLLGTLKTQVPLTPEPKRLKKKRKKRPLISIKTSTNEITTKQNSQPLHQSGVRRAEPMASKACETHLYHLVPECSQFAGNDLSSIPPPFEPSASVISSFRNQNHSDLPKQRSSSLDEMCLFGHLGRCQDKLLCQKKGHQRRYSDSEDPKKLKPTSSDLLCIFMGLKSPKKHRRATQSPHTHKVISTPEVIRVTVPEAAQKRSLQSHVLHIDVDEEPSDSKFSPYSTLPTVHSKRRRFTSSSGLGIKTRCDSGIVSCFSLVSTEVESSSLSLYGHRHHSHSTATSPSTVKSSSPSCYSRSLPRWHRHRHPKPNPNASSAQSEKSESSLSGVNLPELTASLRFADEENLQEGIIQPTKAVIAEEGLLVKPGESPLTKQSDDEEQATETIKCRSVDENSSRPKPQIMNPDSRASSDSIDDPTVIECSEVDFPIDVCLRRPDSVEMVDNETLKSLDGRYNLTKPANLERLNGEEISSFTSEDISQQDNYVQSSNLKTIAKIHEEKNQKPLMCGKELGAASEPDQSLRKNEVKDELSVNLRDIVSTEDLVTLLEVREPPQLKLVLPVEAEYNESVLLVSRSLSKEFVQPNRTSAENADSMEENKSNGEGNSFESELQTQNEITPSMAEDVTGSRPLAGEASEEENQLDAEYHPQIEAELSSSIQQKDFVHPLSGTTDEAMIHSNQAKVDYTYPKEDRMTCEGDSNIHVEAEKPNERESTENDRPNKSKYLQFSQELVNRELSAADSVNSSRNQGSVATKETQSDANSSIQSVSFTEMAALPRMKWVEPVLAKYDEGVPESKSEFHVGESPVAVHESAMSETSHYPETVESNQEVDDAKETFSKEEAIPSKTKTESNRSYELRDPGNESDTTLQELSNAVEILVNDQLTSFAKMPELPQRETMVPVHAKFDERLLEPKTEFIGEHSHAAREEPYVKDDLPYPDSTEPSQADHYTEGIATNKEVTASEGTDFPKTESKHSYELSAPEKSSDTLEMSGNPSKVIKNEELWGISKMPELPRSEPSTLMQPYCNGAAQPQSDHPPDDQNKQRRNAIPEKIEQHLEGLKSQKEGQGSDFPLVKEKCAVLVPEEPAQQQNAESQEKNEEAPKVESISMISNLTESAPLRISISIKGDQFNDGNEEQNVNEREGCNDAENEIESWKRQPSPKVAGDEEVKLSAMEPIIAKQPDFIKSVPPLDITSIDQQQLRTSWRTKKESYNTRNLLSIGENANNFEQESHKQPSKAIVKHPFHYFEENIEFPSRKQTSSMQLECAETPASLTSIATERDKGQDSSDAEKERLPESKSSDDFKQEIQNWIHKQVAATTPTFPNLDNTLGANHDENNAQNGDLQNRPEISTNFQYECLSKTPEFPRMENIILVQASYSESDPIHSSMDATMSSQFDTISIIDCQNSMTESGYHAEETQESVVHQFSDDNSLPSKALGSVDICYENLQGTEEITPRTKYGAEYENSLRYLSFEDPGQFIKQTSADVLNSRPPETVTMNKDDHDKQHERQNHAISENPAVTKIDAPDELNSMEKSQSKVSKLSGLGEDPSETISVVEILPTGNHRSVLFDNDRAIDIRKRDAYEIVRDMLKNSTPEKLQLIRCAIKTYSDLQESLELEALDGTVILPTINSADFKELDTTLEYQPSALRRMFPQVSITIINLSTAYIPRYLSTIYDYVMALLRPEDPDRRLRELTTTVQEAFLNHPIGVPVLIAGTTLLSPYALRQFPLTIVAACQEVPELLRQVMAHPGDFLADHLTGLSRVFQAAPTWTIFAVVGSSGNHWRTIRPALQAY